MKNLVHLIDCMEFMKGLPDNSYDLAIVDPPYNIGKAEWDKWKTIDDYVDFMTEFFIQLQRVLKQNASMYFFHNDFNQMAKIQAKIDKKTDFILKQFIIWNKRYFLSKNKGYFDGYVQMDNLRNYQKLAEYICFYTFQDETGLSKIMGNCVYPIRDYIRSEIMKAKGEINFKKINKILGVATNGGGVASAVLSLKKTTPAFITKDHYLILKSWLNEKNEYEFLRKEYEELRYYFYNRKKCHSVWEFEICSSWHPTPKPIPLIKNILLHSARPGGIVFNPFNGSENIRIACHDMGFDFEGCELDADYWQAQEDRYKKHIQQGELFQFSGGVLL
jgi:DNA modification methylase